MKRQTVNRFVLCRMAVRGARAIHVPGSRMETTIKKAIALSTNNLSIQEQNNAEHDRTAPSRVPVLVEDSPAPSPEGTESNSVGQRTEGSGVGTEGPSDLSY